MYDTAAPAAAFCITMARARCVELITSAAAALVVAISELITVCEVSLMMSLPEMDRPE